MSFLRRLLALIPPLALAACATEPSAPRSAAPALARAAAPGNGPVLTYAVIGDTPYGAAKLAEFPDLIAKINADPDVELVMHAGDIKAGKNAPCTDAYNQTIKGLFDTFAAPLVYTPGDNEWTDCHVFSKNNGLYTPTERLAAVRALFFPLPGRTLGQSAQVVETQAKDPRFAPFVENVLWSRKGVVFAAVNLPGSNNDGAPWGTPLPADAANWPSQADEQATRAAADSAWIAQAFDRATADDAKAVVLLFQADMWDPTEPTLAGFDRVVQQIGTRAQQFGKPVLLLEGDSHSFNVAQPFTPASPYFTLHPNTPVAPNVTRIVVEGSDKGRTEYLKLSIDPRAAYPFSWARVPLR